MLAENNVCVLHPVAKPPGTQKKRQLIGNGGSSQGIRPGVGGVV
jgi:hypothetical protein